MTGLEGSGKYIIGCAPAKYELYINLEGNWNGENKLHQQGRGRRRGQADWSEDGLEMEIGSKGKCGIKKLGSWNQLAHMWEKMSAIIRITATTDELG